MPSIQVANEQIYYTRQGEHGLPVMFVHGAGSNHLVWGHQVRALASLARPVAIDLPGHGQSSPGGRNSITDYAAVIIRFLDAMAFERAVVAGHSMGGAIAQMLAVTYPDRVAGLGLVGTGARLRVLPAILNGIISPDEFENTVGLIVENSYAPENLDPTVRARAIEQLRACSPQVTHDDFAACNAFDVTARLGEIRAPALVLCGTADKMTPLKYSEFLAANLAGARLVVVQGAGHFSMIERAEEVSRALVQFVGGLPAA